MSYPTGEEAEDILEMQQYTDDLEASLRWARRQEDLATAWQFGATDQRWRNTLLGELHRDLLGGIIGGTVAVVCAKIQEYTIYPDHTPAQVKTFLRALGRRQEVTDYSADTAGWKVWFSDGSWADRQKEYFGSYGWDHNSPPPLPCLRYDELLSRTLHG